MKRSERLGVPTQRRAEARSSLRRTPREDQLLDAIDVIGLDVAPVDHVTAMIDDSFVVAQRDRRWVVKSGPHVGTRRLARLQRPPLCKWSACAYLRGQKASAGVIASWYVSDTSFSGRSVCGSICAPA